MSPAITFDSLLKDFSELGVTAGMTLMVHSSLGKIGWTEGGAFTVIHALLETLGPAGTLVMPAESPDVFKPDKRTGDGVIIEWHEAIRTRLQLFDPPTTPTTMGAIPEAFRTFPGTLRSKHPTVSVCANGRYAEEITKDHSLEFCEGKGTPFEKLYQLNAFTLLLGVGFDRCTSLHYAESLVPSRRTTVHHIPIVQEGRKVWLKVPDMANDNGVHFPVVGAEFANSHPIQVNHVGCANSMLFSTRELVDHAEAYFRRVRLIHR